MVDVKGSSEAGPPLVGKAGEHFVGQQWVAAAIITALVIVVIIWRRWAAASRAEWSTGSALWYSINPSARVPQGKQKPDAKGLLVGTDNRVSTSKTTAALWTVIVLYLIATMALIAGSDRNNYATLIQSISLLYLVFLGGPYAAAVLAKATVTNGVNNQQVQKSQADSPRVADVFSDDDGNTDLVDTQYLLFNLLAAIIVVIQFASAPGSGAPTVPDFLAILTGASAATYVTNKALISGNPPALTRVAPQSARQGAQVIAYGANFIAQGDTKRPSVFVNGTQAETSGDAQQDQVTFRIPAASSLGPATVTIQTPSPSDLEATGSTQLTIVSDQLVITSVDSLYKHPSDPVTLFGTGIYNAGNVDAAGAPIAGTNPVPAQITLVDANGSLHPCHPVPDGNSDSKLTVTLPQGLEAGSYRVTGARGSLPASINPPISLRITPS
jgi:hypothetical protein